MTSTFDVSQRWKNYANQRETTGLSSDSLQLHPFSKMGTSLKGKNLLPVPYGMKIT